MVYLAPRLNHMPKLISKQTEPRAITTYRHRRRHVHCAGIGMPVLKMFTSYLEGRLEPHADPCVEALYRLYIGIADGMSVAGMRVPVLKTTASERRSF